MPQVDSLRAIKEHFKRINGKRRRWNTFADFHRECLHSFLTKYPHYDMTGDQYRVLLVKSNYRNSPCNYEDMVSSFIASKVTAFEAYCLERE